MTPREFLLILVISVAPFVEVRGSVPLAYIMEPSNSSARATLLLAALAGNLIIAPAVMPVLDKLEGFLLSRTSSPLIGPIARLYAWAVSGVRRRVPNYVKRYGYLGLALFVAVPVPGSGAWSGTLIAHVLGIKGLKAVAAIEVGVVLAFALLVAAMEGIFSIIP